MQDVVGPAIGRGPLDGHEVRDLLDDAHGGRVAFDVRAHRAEFGFREASASAATTDGRSRGLQGFQQRGEFARTFDQQVEGEAFGGAMPHAGKHLEELADLVEGGGHGRSHPREGEAGRGLRHRGFMQGAGLGRGFLQGEHQGLFDDGLLFLEELGVDREAVDEPMAVDGHADRPAAVGDFEPFRSELLLGLGDAALHLLGLFEEFAYACHK